MTNQQVFFASFPIFVTLVSWVILWSKGRKDDKLRQKEQELALTKQRKDELRLDEVLTWTHECIKNLQTLFLLSSMPNLSSKNEATKRRHEVAFEISVLIETGRLLFKNEVVDDFGEHKPHAYQGYRPVILDHLVIAYQLALAWPDTSPKEKLQRSALALSSVQKFVSLAQSEVGREKTSSTDTKKGGDGIDLRALLLNLTDRQLNEADKRCQH